VTSSTASDQPEHHPTDYPLSEATNTAPQPSALARLATIAPTLKEAELRVLTCLTAAAEAAPHNTVTASSRMIANATRVARSAVQPALDSLAARGLITTSQGTATTPAAHQVNFLQTIVIGGPLAGPPPAQGGLLPGPPVALQPGLPLAPQQGQGGPLTGPPVALQPGLPLALQQGQGGPLTGPPTTRNQHDAPQRSAVDIEYDSSNTIDRVLRAKPKHFDADTITRARGWLHSYKAKFGRQPHPLAPDNAILAQFLAIADWPALEHVLYDLMAERKEPGASYAWFVSVALQRIHGIAPTSLQARRQQLKLIKPTEDTDGRQFRDDLVRSIAAGVKGMR
jgi:hypothetical protein